MADRIVYEEGKYLDVTPLHGKWCTIDMRGNDTGYAQVGIRASGKHYILFQYKDRIGIAAKMYIKDITEVRMPAWKLKRVPPLTVEDWDEGEEPFARFIGSNCDIHVHSTSLFEGNPGFFHARILDAEKGIVRIRENSKEYNVHQYMICGMLECK